MPDVRDACPKRMLTNKFPCSLVTEFRSILFIEDLSSRYEQPICSTDKVKELFCRESLNQKYKNWRKIIGIVNLVLVRTFFIIRVAMHVQIPVVLFCLSYPGSRVIFFHIEFPTIVQEDTFEGAVQGEQEQVDRRSRNIRAVPQMQDFQFLEAVGNRSLFDHLIRQSIETGQLQLYQGRARAQKQRKSGGRRLAGRIALQTMEIQIFQVA